VLQHRGLTHHRDMKLDMSFDVISYPDAKEISQRDHAIKYLLYHEGKQCIYCKYFDLLLRYLVLLSWHRGNILQRLFVCFAVQQQDMR
jgi:hypothetical protein